MRHKIYEETGPSRATHSLVTAVAAAAALSVSDY